MTEVGKIREHNEDVIRVIVGDEKLRARGIDGLYLVADGMGGHGAGEVASAIAADVMVQQCLKQEFPWQNQGFDQLSPDEKMKESLALQEKRKQWLDKAVGQVNEAVFNRRQKEGIDMGTTLVVAIRSGDEVAVANVGDSRAYIISGDGKTIQQITQDHSLVASLVAAKQITAEEARVHPQRNVIYRTIGDKSRVEADVFFAKIPKGGSMVLCSDGLSGMVADSQIGRIVVSAPDSKQAVSGLINAANAAGGEDNISAIVVKRGIKEASVAPEKAAEAELTLTEKVFVAMVEDLVDWEEAAGVIDRGKLQKAFENMRLQFGGLPTGGHFRAKVTETVMSQLWAEGEKLKKAGKNDGEIFEEWLKQVFIPLYRRAAARSPLSRRRLMT